MSASLTPAMVLIDLGAINGMAVVMIPVQYLSLMTPGDTHTDSHFSSVLDLTGQGWLIQSFEIAFDDLFSLINNQPVCF